MNQLYNSKVVQFDLVTRAMISSGEKHLSNNIGINHRGVVLILQNGKKYLVHIVPQSKAVLVDGKQMSNNWSIQSSKAVNTTVGKVMAVAESLGQYNYLPVNCITVAKKIYNSF